MHHNKCTEQPVLPHTNPCGKVTIIYRERQEDGKISLETGRKL